MNDEYFQQALFYITKHRGVYKKPITPETRLGADLGIDGDDASELLEDVVVAFDIDVSEFKYDDYFGPEGLSVFFPIYLILRLLNIQPWPPLKEMTVGHLAEAIRLKKLT